MKKTKQILTSSSTLKQLVPIAAIVLITGCAPTETSLPSTSAAANETSVSTEQKIAATESERLNAWFAKRFEEEAMSRPEFLAQVGVKLRQDEWNDESREAFAARVERARADLVFLNEEVDIDALDEDTALSHRLYIKEAEGWLEREKWNDHIYLFTQMRGAHAGVPTFLLNQHKIENEEDANNYILRLTRLPAKLDTLRERSVKNFDKGIAPPLFVYGHTLRGIDNILSGTPFDDSDKTNLLLENFQTKVSALGLPDEQTNDLIAKASLALTDHVGPTYVRLRNELASQQASAKTDDGAWKLPNGDEYYAYRLRDMTTTDLTADEVHDIGLREVARIHEEMRAIMETVGFEGDLQDFFEFMRTDPQFYYPTTPEGKERYLREATDLIDTMEEVLETVILNLPEAALEVRAVEPFREQAAGKAFYSRPALDGSRPGYYYANLYDMNQMPTYQMEALAYHEGSPGHHMQIALAQELEGVPDFRKFSRVTAYTEGWGLYSEFLPKEMGFYEDPYSDFGRLAMELWRACRLVVDTGLHSKRWTREEAINYLAENTPNPQGDIAKAIERYIVMPGQATAYLIGKIKIVELREKAKAEMGDAFDIREFHDVFLSSGPVPLDILEERVDAYIQEKS